MAGKPREDRSTVATHHFAMRLTDDENEELTELVDAENERLAAEQRPEGATKNSIVRFLIRRAYRELQSRKKGSKHQ